MLTLKAEDIYMCSNNGIVVEKEKNSLGLYNHIVMKNL